MTVSIRCMLYRIHKNYSLSRSIKRYLTGIASVFKEMSWKYNYVIQIQRIQTYLQILTLANTKICLVRVGRSGTTEVRSLRPLQVKRNLLKNLRTKFLLTLKKFVNKDYV